MLSRGWAGAVLMSALACAPAQRPPVRPSILLLVVDGTRADALDRLLDNDELQQWLAGEGSVRFERAYAPSSSGPQSLAALLTGRLPTHGGAIGLAEAQPSEQAITLATRLRRAGYRTGLVSQAPWASRPGFARGFDDLQVAPAGGSTGEQVSARALQVIDDWRATNATEAGGPSFLVVHWAIEGVDRLVGAADDAGGPAAVGPTAVEAAFLDEVGRALTSLHRGLVERGSATATDVVVLTAGHGFERGEHGGAGTGWTLDEEVIRVPLLMRPRPAGLESLVRAPVSTAALWSTLSEIAGSAEEAPGTAVAALPGFRGAPMTPAPVIAELVVRERAIARAVIDGELEYLRVLREVPPADRAVVARGYEELQAAFASGRTPAPPLFGRPVRETLLRFGGPGIGALELPLAEHKQELSRLRGLLAEYRRRCEEEGWPPPGLSERLTVDVKDAEDLEALGYL